MLWAAQAQNHAMLQTQALQNGCFLLGSGLDDDARLAAWRRYSLGR